MSTPLTHAQSSFLADYLDDILVVDPSLQEATREHYVMGVMVQGFDDEIPSTPGQRQVAHKLREKGLLSKLDIHKDAQGQDIIYLEFSEAGAAVLYDLHRTRMEREQKRATAAERQAASKARLRAGRGKRISVNLDGDAVRALDTLVHDGWATNYADALRRLIAGVATR